MNSNIESEFDHVAVLHDILLAFEPHPAFLLAATSEPA